MVMSNNDLKIKEYREKIENKRKTLGEKPKAHFVTNALLPMPDNTKLNINLINTVDSCVDVVQQLVLFANARDHAHELLGTTDPGAMFGLFTFDQWVSDIRIRLSIIQWEIEKKQIDAMDRKLAELLSNDAKTAEAIEQIAKELGV